MEPLLDLFSFQGRANRSWYFWHTFLDGLVIMGLFVALMVIAAVVGEPALAVLPVVGVFIGGVVAQVAITVKRLHDIGRPGWHWWLLLIPLYNIYLSLVLLFKPGPPGPNLFGPDPLSARRLSGP